MRRSAGPPFRDTICAIATPPGIGGVGIVRISGPACRDIARAVTGRLPEPRRATLSDFRDAQGTTIDRGLALYFPAPHSFTGEEVLELQAHGGPVVLQMLMTRAMELGARAARAGEFSERAFLNDRLDLAQAEAIADLVAAGTTSAARAAQQSLSGAFSRRIAELQKQLTDLRVFVEAAIDFPEEEIDFLAESDVLQRLAAVQSSLAALLGETRQGRLLRDGIVLAIAGRPNAGKSSLLNALSGEDSAIVTEIPGTTRDVLREWIDLGGMPVRIADTAGIRDTADPVESEGVRRARQELATADLALLVVDLTVELAPQLALLDELPDPKRALVVYNKLDIAPRGASEVASAVPEDQGARCRSVEVSAKTGAGLEKLRSAIREMVGASEQAEGAFSARQRHIDALQRAARSLESGRMRLAADRAPELLAEELRLAQKSLGEITGEMLPDDLLAAIFSSFCIGK